MDYSKFISKISLNRKPSGISQMRTYMKDASPSVVYLAGGQPNPMMYPYKEVAVTLDDGRVLQISGDLLSTGLQYGPTPGFGPFIKQLREITQKVHNPPCWSSSDVIVTMGCQDAMAKAFEMLLDPGDCVVVEEPCYSDALIILAAVKPRYLKVDSDEGGMRPDSLREVLQQATTKDPSKPPKVMYLVPTACNPTGTTLDEKRRREIYAIASEYDIIIVEDDPYYYIQFDDQERLPPSFLSLDTDGRVLRIDSFSKIICSGLRVGYVTGPKVLLERMVWHMQGSILCPPGITQIMVSELLKDWGEEGFKNHVSKLREFYKSQRDAMVLAANTYLKGLCEWSVPNGGIFLWFKVPALHDTLPMLQKRAAKKDVILVPGKDFMLDEDKPCQYMRAAYSNVTPDQMMTAMKNLAELVKEEIELQNSQTT